MSIRDLSVQETTDKNGYSYYKYNNSIFFIKEFKPSTEKSIFTVLKAVSKNDFNISEHIDQIENELAFSPIANFMDTRSEALDLIYDLCEHEKDLKKLKRVDLSFPLSYRITPEGKATHAIDYGDGITLYHTSTRNFFKLENDTLKSVPPPMRMPNGWYEDNCAWAMIAYCFPEKFTRYELLNSEKILKNWYPDIYTEVTGKIVNENESLILRKRNFEKYHENDLIVISASSSKAYPTLIECTATLGGRRDDDLPRFVYLVPRDEYKPSEYGFILDPTKYELKDSFKNEHYGLKM